MLARVVLGLLAISVPVYAQMPQLQSSLPPPPPHVQVLEHRLIAATGDAIQWQTLYVEAQAKVDELQKQLAEARAEKKPVAENKAQ